MGTGSHERYELPGSSSTQRMKRRRARMQLLRGSAATLLVVTFGVKTLAQEATQGVVQESPFNGQQLPDPGGLRMADPLALLSFDVGEPVKGAPYTAEATTKIVQVLADGNRIVRKANASIGRDSRGRTRREQTLTAIAGIAVAGNSARVISITDPGAHVTYMLDPVQRVARRFLSPATLAPPFRGAIGMIPPGLTGGTGVFPSPPGPTGNPPEQLPGLTPSAPQAPIVKTESLGTRKIEGVIVEGTRTTLTTPAGVIGNERAIEAVYERWFSPELHIIVSSHRSDPLVGDTTYRLTRIDRAEPSSELFEVPKGYRIIDAGKIQ